MNDSPKGLGAIDGRLPPFSLESEGMVLSELIANPESFDRVQSILEEGRFWANANKIIYRCIYELNRDGLLVDAATVANYAKQKGVLDQIGGTPYITQIATETPAPGAYLEQHAERIRDLWRIRAAIQQAQLVVAEGYGDVGDGQEWLESHEHAFSVLAHEHSKRQVYSIGELGIDQVSRINAADGTGLQGIKTGFGKLDYLLTGLHPGDLYIIAGRPGMGKTALVTSMLMNISRPPEEQDGERLGTMLFSLEQPKEQIAMRVLCAESGASFSRVRQNQHHQKDIEKINDYVVRLGDVPLYVDDKPALTLLEMRSEIRKLKRQIEHGTASTPADRLVAVAVDYMQLMQAEKEVRRRGSREQEISSLSQGLKRLAKLEEVAVLALSQLNRRVEERSDKRPVLSDLRESGAIEQDADTIMFLYRDSYYKRGSDDNTCELDVAKQRNGPTEVTKVVFEKETMRFRSLTEDEDMGGENLDEEHNPDGY